MRAFPSRKRWSVFVSFGVAFASLACGGRSEKNGPAMSSSGSGGELASGGSFSEGGGQASGGQASGGRAGASGGVAGSSSGSGGKGVPTAGASAGGMPAACDTPTAPSIPLRRLSPFEYDNSVRDLFGIATRPATELFAKVLPYGSSEESASTVEVDAYHTLAHELASELTSDATRLSDAIGCDPTLTAESICREQLLSELLPRIFRAPVRDEERDQMDAAFAAGEELGKSFASGVRAVLEVALQSPEFLYRVEFGEAAPELGAAMGRPLPHEMAARLSYFLRGAPPDAALSEAAALGQLRSKAQIAEQARRLLAEQDAHAVVRQFHLRHLGLLAPDLAAHMDLGADIAELMMEETARFVDDVTFQGDGDLSALLTAPFTWVNGPLAAHYGIAGVTGAAFEKVSLEPTQRAGLLTQGAFLASHSSAGISNPSQRGHWVRSKLLCTELPPHPSSVSLGLPPAAGLTTRERFEQSTLPNPACTACHGLFDPIGFAFEHYDAVGQFREIEAGKPIDASGEIVNSDAQGSFIGAVELAARLAQSTDVQNCYADGWLAFAYGRDQLTEDACSSQALHAAFAAAKGNVLELLVAVTQTDGFLYRPLSEVAP